MDTKEGDRGTRYTDLCWDTCEFGFTHYSLYGAPGEDTRCRLLLELALPLLKIPPDPQHLAKVRCDLAPPRLCTRGQILWEKFLSLTGLLYLRIWWDDRKWRMENQQDEDEESFY